MIQIKQVDFTYRQETERGQSPRECGISNLNLHIHKGEVVVLCGESGCGKTTVTRLVNGLVPHYYNGELSGEVLVNGKAVHTLPLYETAKLVGSVFQNPRSQFFNVDTNSEIAFGCENMGVPPDEIQRRMTCVAQQFSAQHLMGRSIFELSGGEKQKIACASVAACYPEVIILDEPSSNLDAEGITELREMIAQWKKAGKTILIAEHRLYYLNGVLDRLVYMVSGTIQAEYTQKQLEVMPASAFLAKGLRPLYLNAISFPDQDFCGQPNTIELSGLHFGYKKNNPVLQIERMVLPEGGITAIIGRNGAGKSTFARCVCGLERKCKGIMKNGHIGYDRKQRMAKCYMVMQDVNHQLFCESVLEEVYLSLGQDDENKALNILRSLDLEHLKDVHPMALSGGQKQRVAIAGAIASEKELILYDEPTSGLDLRHMREVAACLRKLQEMGKTQFVITHDIELIESCCTHVIHLEQGQVYAQYTLDDNGIGLLKDFFVQEISNENTAQETVCPNGG